MSRECENGVAKSSKLRKIRENCKLVPGIDENIFKIRIVCYKKEGT
jgi:hypothetical protein